MFEKEDGKRLKVILPDHTDPVIYRIKNRINNKCYIGKTINLKQRMMSHRAECSRNKTKYATCNALYNAIRKYGWDSFDLEIMCEVSHELVNNAEIALIAYYKRKKLSYNLLDGGEGGFDPNVFPLHRSLERNKKISESHKKRLESEEARNERKEQWVRFKQSPDYPEYVEKLKQRTTSPEAQKRRQANEANRARKFQDWWYSLSDEERYSLSGTRKKETVKMVTEFHDYAKKVKCFTREEMQKHFQIRCDATVSRFIREQIDKNVLIKFTLGNIKVYSYCGESE